MWSHLASRARQPRRRRAAAGTFVALVLALAPAACSSGVGENAPDDGGDDATLGPPPVLSAPGNARRLRRLSNREYDNVVRDLLGDDSHPSRSFLEDSFSNGYDNGSVDLAVQSDQVEGYQLAAEALAANAVATRLPTLLGGCDPATAGEATCAEELLARFAPRAFRRPLTETELARLRTVYQAGARAGARAGTTSGGFALGIQATLEALLQSPAFLYREELGTLAGDATSLDKVELTPWELASQLSFLLTGSMPDDELFAAAAEGRLATPDDSRREALRLLGTPAARTSLRQFLHAWLGTDRLATLTKSTVIYPAFGPALASSMATELDRTYDQLVWQGTGSLRELFTTPSSFVDPSLAALYGVPAPEGPGFAPVSLDENKRRGILTRAGFLAVHADQDSSGPVVRGVFVRGAILCLATPPPPPVVPSPMLLSDSVAAGQTTRQRFSQHARDSACRTCHTLIDGIGYAFEHYDGIGVYRAEENGQPIDSTGHLYGTSASNGPFDGVAALADRLVASRELSDCFVRQVFRYAMGQIETDTPDDVAMLAALTSGFTADTSVTELLLALIARPELTTRTTLGTSPPSP